MLILWSLQSTLIFKNRVFTNLDIFINYHKKKLLGIKINELNKQVILYYIVNYLGLDTSNKRLKTLFFSAIYTLLLFKINLQLLISQFNNKMFIFKGTEGTMHHTTIFIHISMTKRTIGCYNYAFYQLLLDEVYQRPAMILLKDVQSVSSISHRPLDNCKLEVITDFNSFFLLVSAKSFFLSLTFIGARSVRDAGVEVDTSDMDIVLNMTASNLPLSHSHHWQHFQQPASLVYFKIMSKDPPSEKKSDLLMTDLLPNLYCFL
ncbi:hypothetical protein AGLY_000822 [Aphis glycines]|uniref:Uncharacterized protein n=1 Tax=Aphis glycines TaxID=307491 RepID=A0A6G0U9L1_APHGL|nr:hypothetical protein AGLY_000822 [Aphis glycines]